MTTTCSTFAAAAGMRTVAAFNDGGHRFVTATRRRSVIGGAESSWTGGLILEGRPVQGRPSLLATQIGGYAHLELVCWEAPGDPLFSQARHYTEQRDAAHPWLCDPRQPWVSATRTDSADPAITEGALGGVVPLPIGSPAAIQGTFGANGNYEAVFAVDPAGTPPERPPGHEGLAHFWRDNDATPPRWHFSTMFGGDRRYAGVALMQDVADGALHVAALEDASGIAHCFRREGPPTWAWSETPPPNVAAVGDPGFWHHYELTFQLTPRGPALIRTYLEHVLALPVADGGIQLWRRANGAADTAWLADADRILPEHEFRSVCLLQEEFGGAISAVRAGPLALFAQGRDTTGQVFQGEVHGMLIEHERNRWFETPLPRFIV